MLFSPDDKERTAVVIQLFASRGDAQPRRTGDAVSSGEADRIAESMRQHPSNGGDPMSLDALYWVATTPLDLPTSQQVGREWCHRVLINLVAHANAAGETFVSDRQQAEELGRDRRDVRAARDLLRAAGVERYTGKNMGRSKVYALDLPGYDLFASRGDAQPRRTGDAVSSGEADRIAESMRQHPSNGGPQ